MRIQFDPNQQYQLDAIRAVTDLFAGQPPAEGQGAITLEDEAGSAFSELGIANQLVLSQEGVRGNLKRVQEWNELWGYGAPDERLTFTIEMETGTGKTYVYLRTIFELNRLYGWTKFVIVVPSIAIREGVLSSLSLMEGHFRELYGAAPFDTWVYDSAQASRLRSFATSNTLQIVILNIQAFISQKSNVIYQDTDAMGGYRPVDFLCSSRPIVILDEPQNMVTDKAKEAIASLEPLFELRYSATHREIVNPVYRLDPVKAYDLGLVKRIEVSSVLETPNLNRPFIRVVSVSARSKLTAALEMDVERNGVTKRKVEKITSAGVDLFDLSGGREAYRGYEVDAFDVEEGWVSFTNGVRLEVGQSCGVDKDVIMRVQIRETIERHFRREQEMRALPESERMKVLSLFFIDRVANYATADGKLRKWFEEEYEAARNKNPDLGMPPVSEVHGGYFAQDKSGPKDSRGEGTTEADRQAYELIMRDKERLLSRSEPMQFIFSHSALREGWDNPNVFQICTLTEGRSEIKKRQEIGRGLRLPVRADGVRCLDSRRNVLTVVANESYEGFAKALQTEMEEDCGVEFNGRVANARRKKQVTLKKGWNVDPEFLALWEKIKPRTRYNVSFSSDDLVKRAAKAIHDSPKIEAPRIEVSRVKIGIAETSVSPVVVSKGTKAREERLYPVPDLLGYLQSRTELTRTTLAAILLRSGRLGDAPVNPQQFLEQATTAIKGVLRDLLVDGVEYERIDGVTYEQRIFEDALIEAYADRLVGVDHSIYRELDLDSEVERDFARALDDREDVKLFVKLPPRFKVETPLGTYNPDWAIVKGEQAKLYLVRETKGSLDPEKRRVGENAKIVCGGKHFQALGVDFATVTRAEDV